MNFFLLYLDRYKRKDPMEKSRRNQFRDNDHDNNKFHKSNRGNIVSSHDQEIEHLSLNDLNNIRKRKN